MAGYRKNEKGMVPGKGANRDPKIRLMRGAKTAVEYKHGMGGLPKTPGRSQKPITLPPTPWDKK